MHLHAIRLAGPFLLITIKPAFWFKAFCYRLCLRDSRWSFDQLNTRARSCLATNRLALPGTLKSPKSRAIMRATGSMHWLNRPVKIGGYLFAVFLLNACDKPAGPVYSVEVAAAGLHSGAISPSGDLAVVGSIYHGGSLWQLTDNARVYDWNHEKSEPSTLIASDFSRDGKWALTATVNTLVLWNVETGEGERFWAAPGEILDARLGPEARTALLGLADHTAVLFDIRRGGILQTFSHQNRVRSVDLSTDGELALTGSEDYSAVLWDVRSGTELRRITHGDDVQLVRLSSDGEFALSMGKYDKALVWETRTGDTVGEVPLKAEHLKRGLRFTTARFSKDNKFLVTGRPDQWVELWSMTSPPTRVDGWQLPKRNAWKPTGASVIDVAFAGEDTIRAIASNGFIHTLTRNKKPGQ